MRSVLERMPYRAHTIPREWRRQGRYGMEAARAWDTVIATSDPDGGPVQAKSKKTMLTRDERKLNREDKRGKEGNPVRLGRSPRRRAAARKDETGQLCPGEKQPLLDGFVGMDLRSVHSLPEESPESSRTGYFEKGQIGGPSPRVQRLKQVFTERARSQWSNQRCFPQPDARQGRGVFPLVISSRSGRMKEDYPTKEFTRVRPPSLSA